MAGLFVAPVLFVSSECLGLYCGGTVRYGTVGRRKTSFLRAAAQSKYYLAFRSSWNVWKKARKGGQLGFLRSAMYLNKDPMSGFKGREHVEYIQNATVHLDLRQPALIRPLAQREIY